MISRNANFDLFHPLEDALAALRAGRLVIVVDAEGRENEGDLVCAAEKATQELVDFMLRKGAGVLCASLQHEVAERLKLSPLVDSSRNTAPNQTQFLTPIDHRDAGSGVSAVNRTKTLKALSEPASRAAEFVRPGHLAPLLARDGGVLRRAGHTEATVDLLKIAGMTPVGALIEICSQKGNGMADLAELLELSHQYDIPLISIEQLIRYRYQHEQLAKREVEVPFESRRYGQFKVIGYTLQHHDVEPVAIVWGDLSSVLAPLVHIHSSCLSEAMLDSFRCDFSDQLNSAIQVIRAEGVGAIVFLPNEDRSIGLTTTLKKYQSQGRKYDTLDANQDSESEAEIRNNGIGQQILKDLGLSAMRLFMNNTQEETLFSGFDPAPTHHSRMLAAGKRSEVGES